MMYFIGAALLLSGGVHLRMAWRLRRAEMAVLEMLALPVSGTVH